MDAACNVNAASIAAGEKLPAAKLFGLLIGIMGIGIMRVLYRARRPMGDKLQLPLDHFELFRKNSPQQFHRFTFSELG
jgi:hypothetical protein